MARRGAGKSVLPRGQAVQWMTSVPDRGDIRTGWGGRAS